MLIIKWGRNKCKVGYVFTATYFHAFRIHHAALNVKLGKDFQMCFYARSRWNYTLAHLHHPANKLLLFFAAHASIARHHLIIHLTSYKACNILSNTLQSQCSNNIFIIRPFLQSVGNTKDSRNKWRKRLSQGKKLKRREYSLAAIIDSENFGFIHLPLHNVRRSLCYLVIVTRGAFLITVYASKMP